MKKICCLIVFFLGLITLHGTSLEASHGKKRKEKMNDQKKHYCLYLDKKEGKEKGLTIRIPDSFHNPVKVEEPGPEVIFISGDDLPNNLALMKENISFREFPNFKLDEFIYASCLSTCKVTSLEMVLSHYVEFTREDGVLSGTIFFDRPSMLYAIGEGTTVGPASNELIFFKAYQGKDRVLVVQYREYALKFFIF